MSNFVPPTGLNEGEQQSSAINGVDLALSALTRAIAIQNPALLDEARSQLELIISLLSPPKAGKEEMRKDTFARARAILSK